MSKHTPGPWGLNPDLTIRVEEWEHCQQMGDYRGCIITDLKPALGVGEDFDLDKKQFGRAHALPETIANGHLMAAAPDMYEACKEFVRKCECGEARSVRSYAQMKAALAKAEGKGDRECSKPTER